MLILFFRSTGQLRLRLVSACFVATLAVVGVGWLAVPALAQSDVGGGDDGTCVLKSHVYTCDGAAFQRALAGATTVTIETHNSDGVARAQLKDFVTGKLGKTVAAAGSPADLDFLLIPTSPEGVLMPGETDAALGTLRVYSTTASGARGHLLWAETFSGPLNTPWLAVVRGLLRQFHAHFPTSS
jgi:hypothetical protein